jgi:hypothetical protein
MTLISLRTKNLNLKVQSCPVMRVPSLEGLPTRQDCYAAGDVLLVLAAEHDLKPLRPEAAVVRARFFSAAA